MIIWIPDEGATTTIEWYISDKKAVGVEGIRDEWRAKPVAEKKQTGFSPPKDKLA